MDRGGQVSGGGDEIHIGRITDCLLSVIWNVENELTPKFTPKIHAHFLPPIQIHCTGTISLNEPLKHIAENGSASNGLSFYPALVPKAV